MKNLVTKRRKDQSMFHVPLAPNRVNYGTLWKIDE